MIDAVKALTPQEKLALSRSQLLAAMGYEEMGGFDHATSGLAAAPSTRKRPAVTAFGATLGRGVLRRWWRRHPLNSALQLAEPSLENYAQRHPNRLMAYSAGTGAVLWLLKPWKLLSFATVVPLILKGSDISGVISDIKSKGHATTGQPALGSPTGISPA